MLTKIYNMLKIKRLKYFCIVLNFPPFFPTVVHNGGIWGLTGVPTTLITKTTLLFTVNSGYTLPDWSYLTLQGSNC